jgi:hypothetical protein
VISTWRLRAGFLARFARRLWDEARFAETFFGGGTLPPAARASDNPIAIACLRLVTFLPELPLFKVPAFISFMTSSTFSDAFLPYLRAMSLSLVRKDAALVLSVKAVTGRHRI